MENSLLISRRSKHRITIWPSNLPSWYIPQRTESRDSNKYVGTSVRCNIIHKRKKKKKNSVVGGYRHQSLTPWHQNPFPILRVI